MLFQLIAKFLRRIWFSWWKINKSFLKIAANNKFSLLFAWLKWYGNFFGEVRLVDEFCDRSRKCLKFAWIFSLWDFLTCFIVKNYKAFHTRLMVMESRTEKDSITNHYVLRKLKVSFSSKVIYTKRHDLC